MTEIAAVFQQILVLSGKKARSQDHYMALLVLIGKTDVKSGKLASLYRSWQSTLRASGMAGSEHMPSMSGYEWTPLSPWPTMLRE